MKPPRVLLVEDEAKTRDSIVEGMTLEGWQVRSAAQGASGLQLAQAEPADLIVLDWMLPDLAGWRCCAASAPRAGPRRC